MTKAEKLALLKDRYNALAANPKNWGIVRKLKRKIMKWENSMI